MAASPDVNFQNLSTVQSGVQPLPARVTAAATIAPTGFLTFITGTTAVNTITPPIQGAHMLALIPATTNFGGFGSTGNIAVASLTNSTTWGTRASYFVWDPASAKYYPTYGVTTTNS